MTRPVIGGIAPQPPPPPPPKSTSRSVKDLVSDERAGGSKEPLALPVDMARLGSRCSGGGGGANRDQKASDSSPSFSYCTAASVGR